MARRGDRIIRTRPQPLMSSDAERNELPTAHGRLAMSGAKSLCLLV